MQAVYNTPSTNSQTTPMNGRSSAAAIMASAKLHSTAGDEAIAFLRLIDPEGVHQLVAMRPGAGPVASLNCRVSTDADKIRDWVNQHDGVLNIYWTTNEVRPGAIEKHKPSGDHVVAIRVAHVDIDLPGTNTQEELDRLLADIRSKTPAGLEASAVISSGGGYQLIFVLGQKLPVAEAREAIEALNNGLIAHFGGDKGTWNIERLARLPGPQNLPDSLKQAKGRVERKAVVLAAAGATFTIEGLGRHFQPIAPLESGDRSAEINAAIDELKFASHETVMRVEDLSTPLAQLLEAAMEAQPKIRRAFAGDYSGTAAASGSGKRAMVALLLAHHADLSLDDFATFIWLWGVTAEGLDYAEQKLTARDIARLYVRKVGPVMQTRTEKADARESIIDSYFEVVPERELTLPKGVLAIDALIDATAIPRRNYVMYPALLEGDICQVVGEPGISKSSLMLTFALAISADREDLVCGANGEFGAERLHRTGPSIVFNAEDRVDEMQRRLVVAQRAAGITAMKHKVYTWSGIDGDDLQVMHRTAKDGPLVRSPKAQLLEDLIAHTGAVFVALDPQVGLMAGGHENDADDMNALFAELTRISTRHKCAIMVVHHSAKSSRNDTGDMGMGRGSFAQAGKVRSQMTLTNVDSDDAVKWGFSGQDDLFQLGYGKVSYGPKPRTVKILRRNNVTVGNGTGKIGEGDPFAGTSRERAERMGDSAPELEIIGLVNSRRGKATNDGAAPVEDPHVGKRQAVAHAALAVLAGQDQITLSEAWPGIGRALVEAKMTKASSRQSITQLVTIWLAGAGEVVNQDGQNVRVRLEKEGPGPTASWILRAEREELARLASLANESVFA